MNSVQNFIDRQLGIYYRFGYDNILRRLVVSGDESFYGLAGGESAVAGFDHDPPIFACRFAETDGYRHILALANEDGRVAIQDTTNATRASTLEGFQCHNNAVFDLMWMPSHMNFVTVSGDHTACLWDVADGGPKQVSVFSSHTKSVKTVAFQPTEPSVFATGARDGHILIWDVRANNQPTVVLKPDNCLMNCHSSFTPKTPGSHSKRTKIDSNQRAISITGLAFQDDYTLLSCGECDGNIKVWDLRKNYSIYTREPLPKHAIPYCGSSTKNGYTNLLIDSARIRLYASCMDDVIYCFNIATYNALPEQRYVGHENRTFYIKTSLSPDGVYLVSGSSDKHAYVWNVRYCHPVVRLGGHRAEVTCAAWRRAGDAAIATCGDDARHYIWRLGPETPGPDEEYRGRAELVPVSDRGALPRWGAPDRTPSSLKRRAVTTPSSSAKRPRNGDTATFRKTKRCLVDSMNAMRDSVEAEHSAKRARLMSPVAELDESVCGKRRAGEPLGSPEKRVRREEAAEWTYEAPPAGSSFLTPTKNYEKRSCRVLSPRSPAAVARSPGKGSPSKGTPVRVSPGKVVVLSWSPPTRDLPDFVRTGEAPHLRLMSPAKKRAPPRDWLTRLAHTKTPPPLPPPAHPAAPTRRPSTDKTPKSEKKPRTLLKYFSVSSKKEKC